MEIVIPPRDHAQSAYRYRWDENGDVADVTRVSEPSVDSKRGRQTVQWPFQSISTDTPISSPLAATFGRRATWQPRGALDEDDSNSPSSPVDKTIIPDYVINYLRGETPETVARRKRNGGKIGERDVDIAHQHRPHQSRAAELSGFLESRSTGLESRAASSSASDEQHILSGSREKPVRSWRRLGHGWRGGVALNGLLSILILIVGFVALIILAARRNFVDGGESAVYSGSCGTASSLDWGAHALINVFTVVLVAGANYVFQVLSSPTRPELAVAHDRRKWLDIGIPSIRNFRHISGGRVFLSLVILVAAIATQVIYNAIIITSQVAVDYQVLFVTESFLTGSPFSNETASNEAKLSRLDILALQDLASRDQLVNLTVPACAEEFGGLFDTNFKAVLLVTNSANQDSSLVQTSTGSASVTYFSTQDSPSQLSFNGADVQFCLAQPSGSQACTISVNAALLGAVLLLNLATILTVATVIAKSSFEPLVTLGDAIDSFITEPDPTTRDCCLMTKRDVWQGRWGLVEPKYWVPADHYWFRTPSLPRWALASLLWLALAVPAAAALVITTRADPDGALSPFGAASPHAVYLLPLSLTAPIAAALIAALPQVLLAALYLATNALLTTYFLSHEAAQHALGAFAPLRVSADPRGSQTTSLYLTLPRPWSWLVVSLFAGLGFVLSQSVLVVDVDLSSATTSSSAADTLTRVLAVGFSGVALLALLALLVALAALVLGMGCRRAPPAVLVNGQAVGNPLALPAGSCSAVLSARCHAVPAEVAADAARLPLVWGVVHDGRGAVGHCAYSARAVAQLDVARSYA